MSMSPDVVNHPAHYTSHPSGVECIQISRYMLFDLGNAFKYLWRAGLKDAKRIDVEKARWYLNDYLTNSSGVMPSWWKSGLGEYAHRHIAQDAWAKVVDAEGGFKKLVEDDLLLARQNIVDAHSYENRDYIWKALLLLDGWLTNRN